MLFDVPSPPRLGLHLAIPALLPIEPWPPSTADKNDRVRGATEKDHSKLDRVLRYLNATAYLGLTLEVSDPIVDGKSHTGTVITLGKSIVYAKSSKQKVVSK